MVEPLNLDQLVNLESIYSLLGTQTALPIDEIEYRIGTYRDSKFIPGVSVNHFTSILKKYRDQQFPMKISTLLTVRDDQDVRARIEDSGDDRNYTNIRKYCMTGTFPSGTTFVQKRNIGKRNYIEADVRLSVASERSVDRQVFDLDAVKHFRYARRYTFTLVKADDYMLQLDLTTTKDGQVSQNFQDSHVLEMNEKYEVELELSNISLPKWNTNLTRIIQSHLRLVLEVTQGGLGLITTTSINTVREEYRRLFNLTNPNFFVAPNINVILHETLDDMRQTQYVYTDKVHGKRMLLYINPSGHVFLIDCISSDENTQKCRKIQFMYTGITGKEAWANTVFDGEYIYHDNEHRYYIFDILYKEGQDVRGLPFYVLGEGKLKAKSEGRMASRYYELGGFHPDGVSQTKPFYKTIFEKTYQIRGENIVVEPKKFSVYDPVHLKEQLTVSINFGYEEDIGGITSVISMTDVKSGISLDGLIFQPSNVRYPVLTEDTPVRNTLWVDVHKWKPATMTTMDLKVKKSSRSAFKGDILGKENDIIQSYHTFYGKDQSSVYPCYAKVQKDHSVTWETGDVIKEGDIVECRYIEYRTRTTGVSDQIQKYWLPLRVRYDKSWANSSHVYNSNMSLIKDPILLTHLYGENYRSRPESDPLTTSVRTIHKSIKEYVLRKYGGRAKSLLDLCFGRATEATRWLRLERIEVVVGVDNDDLSCQEGIQRIRTLIGNFPELSKIQIGLYCADAGVKLHEFGPLKQKLEKARQFQLVTCFFGLHYLATPEKYPNFVANVSHNLDIDGHFIVADLDRDRVLSLFQEDSSLIDGQHVIRKDRETVQGFVDGTLVWSISKPLIDIPEGQFVLGERINIVIPHITGPLPKEESLVSLKKGSVMDSLLQESRMEQVEFHYFDEFKTPQSLDQSKHKELKQAFDEIAKPRFNALRVWRWLHFMAVYKSQSYIPTARSRGTKPLLLTEDVPISAPIPRPRPRVQLVAKTSTPVTVPNPITSSVIEPTPITPSVTVATPRKPLLVLRAKK